MLYMLTILIELWWIVLLSDCTNCDAALTYNDWLHWGSVGKKICHQPLYYKLYYNDVQCHESKSTELALESIWISFQAFHWSEIGKNCVRRLCTRFPVLCILSGCCPMFHYISHAIWLCIALVLTKTLTKDIGILIKVDQTLATFWTNALIKFECVYI